MSFILKGGTIVNASETYEADVRIADGKIIDIGVNIEPNGEEIVHVKGCYLIPGGIDTHTHFDLDVGTTITADDFESGTKAALVGGTTTILDFATQSKGETLSEGLSKWKEKSDGRCYCDYGFHMAITDWNEDICDEMEAMVKEGVTSFKLYMAYKGSLQVDDTVIFKVLKKSKEIGTLIGFHCENGDVISELVNEAKEKGCLSPKYHSITRPAILEAEATSRLMKIAKVVGSRVYVVHLSCEEALDEVIRAKAQGVEAFIETCPQYLLLNSGLYELNGFESAKYVISPPLRTVDDSNSLWKALQSGDIDIIGTDHCSFNFCGQKDIGVDDFSKIPNGGPGVEHRISLLYTYGVKRGKISLNKLVELTSTNPAKLFGMYPRKGTIQVGSEADITILNPSSKMTIKASHQIQNVDYTPYEGYEIDCKIDRVYLRGTEVVRDGKLIVGAPIGRYIRRSTN